MNHSRRRVSVWVTVVCLIAAPAAAQDAGARPVEVAELTADAQAAIERGLTFLASTQRDDGGWADKNRVACTALSLMSFMLQGRFPDLGPDGARLAKAVTFLLNQAEPGTGYMGQSMYEHALATLALSEAWGMSQDARLRGALKRAVAVILRAQHPGGGWRYKPEPIDQDLSVTVMQVVALASAQEAGILVPIDAMQRAERYVRSCRMPDNRFAYQPGVNPSPAMTAAGVMGLVMVGQGDDEAARAGLERLSQLGANDFHQTRHYFYTHYYAVQAMYQGGEEYFQRWYPKISAALLQSQQRRGQWNSEYGPDFGTAMSVLILGVPYRYLPIYQR